MKSGSSEDDTVYRRAGTDGTRAWTAHKVRLTLALALGLMPLEWGCRGPEGLIPERRAIEREDRLRSYRIRHDSPVDSVLQAGLEEIDRRIGEELGIPDTDRACGVLDLTDLRLALVRPDALFYGASVPKIAIILGYFETHPDAALARDPHVEAELGLVIKRSDNELAAKYSQVVGLETLQAILTSGRYRLYDPEHGGGLWCGKHYGIPEPRTGDPLGNYSHAATVRQCLRFYLMLEQGRLVSPAACRLIFRIFAAPRLDFHDSNFVAGLKGRDVTIIRKSGLWEDWHLDTARIQHGDRVYLLAGMAHHPRGQAYLASLAAAVDDLICGPSTPRPFSHQLHLHDNVADFQGGSLQGAVPSEDPPGLRFACEPQAAREPSAEYLSPPIEAGLLFNEALVSWNVRTPPGTGVSVEIRVGRRFDSSWSPFLHVGDWGELPPGWEKTKRFDGGEIDIDYFRSEKQFDRLQYRVRAFCAEGSGGDTGGPRWVHLARIAICLSDTTGIPYSLPVRAPSIPEPAAEDWQRRLPVPFRSQKTEDPGIAGDICSPTSVAMVMAYRGVDRPTAEVAGRIFDPDHRIYGNWPRAVQAAYSYGIPGYLARVSDWNSVKHRIAAGQPLIISIRAARGELTGAPYPSTTGHLLVLVGFDREGNVLVNDPAARTPEEGRRTYLRHELEKVWMRSGGTTYLLLPRTP